MLNLIPPHGGKLKPLLLKGEELKEAMEKAKSLPQIRMTSRERDDLIMMGIGAFSPLEGFMGKADWKGVCDEMKMANGIFWPIPITLSVTKEVAKGLKEGQEVALIDDESNELMGSMVVQGKYTIDKIHECKQVFKTDDIEHPGVAKVMGQAEVNIAGPVKVFSESDYPEKFKGIYATPEETRKLFEERGWRTIAALQLRNPMHRSHEYLAKIALEVSDGLFVHQLIGKLKAGDIPADVRVRCIDTLVEYYFPKERVIQKGYPLEMRYAGPREALLHAVFRQNYGATHLIVGRDHAGVGEYYGPFEAQDIFDQIPPDALMIKPLKIDWTFYCYKCVGMASPKTCPHGKDDQLILSGTKLRKMLSEGEKPPVEFSRPEVLDILIEYYKGLEEKVEIKLHKFAEGKT
ncbi:MAG: sulfate adenylyltransferase [Thermodesulfobacteriota bacterium]|nr:sulfate adenylyltransferase [Thermodesulfobacteriota bacterium]